MRSACLIHVLALVFALAGCAGAGEDPEIPVSRMAELVLQPGDLSRAFERFDEGRLARADSTPLRIDLRRFDRLDGWKSRWRRPGSAATRGPLVVESRADLFEADDGAQQDLDAYRAEFERYPGGSLTDAPGLGDESVALTVLGQGTAPVRFYTVAWRYRNLTASVSVNGFKVGLGQAVALARKQERRIVNSAE